MKRRGFRRLFFSLFTAIAALAWCAPALALDPNLDASQYGHTAWRIRDGFAASFIRSIAQTPDGYLWLGTGNGLFRFDGVRTVPWQSLTSDRLPSQIVQSLLVGRNGRLWIGTDKGLASWKDGKLTRYPQLGALLISGVAEGRDGTIWAGEFVEGGVGRLCAIPTRPSLGRCYGQDGLFGTGPQLVRVDNQGALWIGAGRKVWRWAPGPPRAYALPDNVNTGFADDPGRKGAVLISTFGGLRRIEGDKNEPYPVPGMPSAKPEDLLGLLRDHDGGLWIGTLARGLFHVHQGRTDVFDRSDGLSGNWIAALFEDREGNVWGGGMDGLDRFHDVSVATLSAKQGLSGSSPSSVLAARDGSVWITTYDGVTRWQNGQVTIYRSGVPGGGRAKAPGRTDSANGARTRQEIFDSGLLSDYTESLFQDARGRVWLTTANGLDYFDDHRFVPIPAVLPPRPAEWVYAFAEGRKGLWVSNFRDGLLLLAGQHVQRRSWHQLGRKDFALALLSDPAQDGLWLGFWQGGLAYLVDGQIRRSFTPADGLGQGMVTQLQFDANGALWAATQGGLSRMKGGRISTLSSKNGLPCDTVHWAMWDDDRALWLYTPCGLLRIVSREMDAWIADPKRRIDVAVFDATDGVRTEPFGKSATPPVAKTADGKIWFLPSDGVSVVDPHRLHFNTLPPPVHVEQVIADRVAYNTSSPIRLPPLVRDLEIDYTALSFVAPEKNHFRYKLEGHDRDWQDPGTRRQAFYTDLPPGDYRFRVVASNNSGVWNKEGATLAFSIAPAYWQTNWFLALCAAAVVTLLWAAYRTRVRQLAKEAAFAQQFETRQREMSLELAHANRVATIGQLTASIAHEVNQPIAAAITNAQAALRWLGGQPPDLEEARAALANIVKSGNRAGAVIDGVRALAKKTPPQKVRLDINIAIREVIELTRQEAEKNGVSVQADLANDLPFIEGDRVQLQQVILNLIVNAIQAMAATSEGPRALLICSAKADSGGVTVEVQDTGPGLPPERLERLFEAFYTTKPGGLGMGLSICQSIVEAHGGRMWATANAPRGAIFHFTVPAQGGEA